MHEADPRGPSSKGYRLLQILVLGLFCLMTLRLWHFQIIKGQEYAHRSQQNLLRERNTYPLRGQIRDRHGRILAENLPAYSLALIREAGSNTKTTLSRVSNCTKASLQEVKNRYNKRKDHVEPFEPLILKSHLDFSELACIESRLASNPALRIIPRAKRHYPSGPIFSHIIGYVSQASQKDIKERSYLQPDDLVGKRGLEYSLDRRLRGSKGRKRLEVDARGRVLRERIVKEPDPGERIRLSIDAELQHFIWQQMGDRTGVALVMHPDTGELLSLVSKPGYDNNSFVGGIQESKWQELLQNPRDPLRNRAVQSAYPPGSVFKLVIASTALNNEDFSKSKERNCPGFYQLGNQVFRCWKEGGHGEVALKKAIKESCDVYFYKLGEELGIDNIANYSREHGFHSRTKINLPDEKTGLIPSREWKKRRLGRSWQGGDTLNTSIGQGYTLVTPLQIARYVSALLNGGYLLKPTLLSDKEPRQQGRLPLEGGDLNFLLGAMQAAVEEPHGTAWRLRMPNATMGAKTGTAQVVRLTKEYKEMDLEEIPYKYRDHGWMASYGIQGDKKYVVVALIEHGGHGSRAAGPLLRAIYERLFTEGGSS